MVAIFLATHFYGSDTVKIIESKLHFSVFNLIFFFFLFSFFYFLFLEQLVLGLEVIGHTVTSVTIWWYGHNIDHKTWENGVEGSRTNNVIQYG